jgi:hypothetical protein
VPWCATCDRFLSPATVRSDGSCPTCGRVVEPGSVTVEATNRRRAIPWHLKALLGVFALYLGYRAFQGIEWLVDRL